MSDLCGRVSAACWGWNWNWILTSLSLSLSLLHICPSDASTGSFTPRGHWMIGANIFLTDNNVSCWKFIFIRIFDAGAGYYHILRVTAYLRTQQSRVWSCNWTRGGRRVRKTGTYYQLYKHFYRADMKNRLMHLSRMFSSRWPIWHECQNVS